MTRRFPPLLAVVVASQVCVSQALELGDRIPRGAKKIKELAIVAAADFKPVYVVKVNGSSFSVCVDGTGQVIYVAPRSRKFTTPEGVHVDSLLDEVEAKTGSQPSELAGIGFVSRLPSGWFAAFDLREGPPKHGARVIEIFKSKWAAERVPTDRLDQRPPP